MKHFAFIQHFISEHNLIHQNDTIVIGLSGGPDSVFLFHVLLHLQPQYNLTLIAAHLNHEWRSEADAEEKLCRQLSKKHNIPFVSTKLSSIAHNIKQNGSKEEYARKIRRIFLEKVAQEYNARTIALGHHAQDQQETFFIRLIRGTSLTGLTGMDPQSGMYIRPLLETNKQNILAWLDEYNIQYATDISNISPLYLRNRIRSTILPALQTCDNRFDANFLKTIKRLKETDNFLEKIAQETLKNISTQKNGTLLINATQFANIDSALHHRMIVHWLIAERVPFTPTENLLDEIVRFLLSPRGGTHNIHQHWSIVKKQGIASIVKI